MPKLHIGSRNQALIQRVADKVRDRVLLQVGSQLLRDSGPAADLLSKSGPASEREERLRQGRALATQHLQNFSQSSSDEHVKRNATTLLGNAAAALSFPARRAIPAGFIKRGKPGGTLGVGGGDAQVNWGNNWKYMQLRVDQTKCIKRVKASATWELEGSQDEMYLVGTLIDLAAIETDQRQIEFHLGDFKTGDRYDYGSGSGSRVVSYADISNATTFPTKVLTMLSVVEKDWSGPYMKILTMLAEASRDAAIEIIEGDDPEGEEEEEQEDSPIIIIIIEAIKLAFAAIIKFFAQIAAPEVLKLDGSGELVFSYKSPKVTAPSDVWASSANKSPTETFNVKGYGGEYEIKMFYKRSDTAKD